MRVEEDVQPALASDACPVPFSDVKYTSKKLKKTEGFTLTSENEEISTVIDEVVKAKAIEK